MKLYLTRHTRTNYNDLDLFNSDPTIDVHITPEGVKQAEKLAGMLKDVPIERMFVSELRRTQQTAAIVNQFHHAPIEVEPLLNDFRSGFEGKPTRMVLDAIDSAKDKWTGRHNQGESLEDMKKRVASFFEQLKARPYEVVLVVTHGWVIRMAVAVIQGISNEDAWIIDVEQGDYLEFDI